MIQVPAMTAFKFPAALRSNVYRERPSHEQRNYVTRIERERLFIERELAAAGARQACRPGGTGHCARGSPAWSGWTPRSCRPISGAFAAWTDRPGAGD